MGKFVCFRGLALPPFIINKMKKQKYIKLDGYSSASLDEKIAANFAAQAETDDADQVLMRITMENESGKYYVSLDREDYTCYPNEKEILL